MGVVILVRHGQASFGADDYDVLSETGWKQGRLLGDWLREKADKPTSVVRGSMRRHRETAEAAGWSDAVVDPGWDEFDHLGVVARGPGSRPRSTAEGDRSTDELDRRAFQEAFVAATGRWSGGEHDDEYDESWPAFVRRVTTGLERVCARDGVTVVVSSGGPIAVACAALVDPEATPAELPRLWNAFNTVCANTGVTRVIAGSTGRRMLTFNEHSHLARDQVTYR